MYYQREIKSVLDELVTNSATGLKREEVEKRLKKFGPNELPSPIPPSYLQKFFLQFKSLLIVILLIAAIFSAVLRDLLDALVIFAIMILNAAIGSYQEIKAEKILSALKEKDIPHTLVLRDKQSEKIRSSQLVPGDILILEEGEVVPADGRIIESFGLTVDESILTGESQTVLKQTALLTEKNLPLADRTNMIFRETRIISGRGKAVVTGTGISTETGKISQFLEAESEEKSPLTLELDRVGKMLTVGILIIAFIIFILSGFKNLPLIDRILISVSLAVAAIPEGLPAIVTITLALGVERLASKRTIVKNLNSIQSLGALKIIATDKTGTLTENKINVTDIITPDSVYKVRGDGYEKSGSFLNQKGDIINPLENPDFFKLLRCGTLANNSALKNTGGSFEIIGDTTEGALLIAAERANIPTQEVKQKNSRLFELPFTPKRKMMSVVVKDGQSGEAYLYTKGAPEEVLKICRGIKTQKYQLAAEELAEEGLRTLALAYKKLTTQDLKNLLEADLLKESDLNFLGIIGAQDTLRPQIKETVAKAKLAGIKTIMITGDHLKTATAIGLESGIIDSPSQAVSEKEIENCNHGQIAEILSTDKYRVFARASPFGKLKIIESARTLPNVQIGATGDGVNDAPALKAANVGIAMGTGTDIAKEFSDLVITDDDYATIIDAVREGRIIFANLIKFIRYLISCNFAEVFVVALAAVFVTPLPLLPIQLLWINLITDGLPALALGMDPPEFDIMHAPLKPQQFQLIHKRRWSFMLAEGLIMGISVFLLYLFSLRFFNEEIGRTIAFASLSFTQLVHALNNRSTRKSIFRLGLFSNNFLIFSIILSLALQILAISTGFGHLLFKTVSLSLVQWCLVITVSLIPFMFVELKKIGLKKLNI